MLFRAESEIAIRHSVHNTGKAIPEEDPPHLFERFYRIDKSRARTDNGYGLGLAIAQTIAKTTVVRSRWSVPKSRYFFYGHIFCVKRKRICLISDIYFS